MSDLTALFAPRSVAVLGVSRNPAKLGHRLLENLKSRGFAGSVHPVNPSGGGREFLMPGLYLVPGPCPRAPNLLTRHPLLRVDGLSE